MIGAALFSLKTTKMTAHLLFGMGGMLIFLVSYVLPLLCIPINSLGEIMLFRLSTVYRNSVWLSIVVNRTKTYGEKASGERI